MNTSSYKSESEEMNKVIQNLDPEKEALPDLEKYVK